MNLFECDTVEELESMISEGADLEQLNPPLNLSLGSANVDNLPLWYSAIYVGAAGRETPLSVFTRYGKHDHVMCLLKHGANVSPAAYRKIVDNGWTDAITLCN